MELKKKRKMWFVDNALENEYVIAVGRMKIEKSTNIRWEIRIAGVVFIIVCCKSKFLYGFQSEDNTNQSIHFLFFQHFILLY
jgi:hypothetical protein